jgi:diguanylate cyclase (GGDEF)-like protein
MREEDIICRYGGEEFAVLLPETNEEQAMLFANRLQKVISETRVVIDDMTLLFTVSIGVNEMDGTCKTFDTHINRADEAMYRAKNLGRNRVESWGAEA